jgi:hypothetical protein
MGRTILESASAEVTSYGVDSYDVLGSDELYHNYAFLTFDIFDADGNVVGTTRKSYEMGTPSAEKQGVAQSMQDFKAFVPQLAIERQTVKDYYAGN